MPTTRRARRASPPSSSSGRARSRAASWPRSPELGRDQRQQLVRRRRPRRGIAPGATAGTLVEHALQALLVTREHRIVRVEQGEQLAGELAAVRVAGHPVVDPVLLAETLEQAAIVEQLEVAGDARLALAEDRRQLGHRELSPRKDGEQSQARGLRDRAQTRQQGVEGDGHESQI